METVDEPILDQSKIRFILEALGGDFYSPAEKEQFTNIIYQGFADPYGYDAVYADFLTTYFQREAFAADAAKSIIQEKVFHKMFDGRGSDEEYHTEVLKWNLDNLRLRFYADDQESLVYLVSVLANRYSIALPAVEPNEFPTDYWGRAHSLVSATLHKTILIEDRHYGVYFSDNNRTEQLREILKEIDLNLIITKK